MCVRHQPLSLAPGLFLPAPESHNTGWRATLLEILLPTSPEVVRGRMTGTPNWRLPRPRRSDFYSGAWASVTLRIRMGRPPGHKAYSHRTVLSVDNHVLWSDQVIKLLSAPQVRPWVRSAYCRSWLRKQHVPHWRDSIWKLIMIT